MLNDKLTDNSYFNYYSFSSETPQHPIVGFTNGGNPCTKESPCKVTYDSANQKFTNENGGENSVIKTALEDWYSNNLNEVDSKIEYGYFCNDISYGSGTDDMNNSTDDLSYGAYERLFSDKKNVTPTLVCPEQVDANREPRTYGGLYKSKIGLITADELAMGGYSYNSPYVSTKNYLKRSYGYWTASPFVSNNDAFIFYSSSYLDYGNTYTSKAVVPVINLKTDGIKYSGTGEEATPITIETN